MLVDQERRDRSYSNIRNLAQLKYGEQDHKENQHHDVKEPGYPHGAGNSPIAWNGMQAGLLIEFVVLAGIQDIETTHPEHDCCGQQQNMRMRTAFRICLAAEALAAAAILSCTKACGVGVGVRARCICAGSRERMITIVLRSLFEHFVREH